MKINFCANNLEHFVFAITNNEKKYDDYHISLISNRELKYLALAILNKDNERFEEYYSMIKLFDLAYVARVIKYNETYIKALYVSQIEYGMWKAFALALNWKEKEEDDVLVRLINDDAIRYAVLAINNNEQSYKDKWIQKLINSGNY